MPLTSGDIKCLKKLQWTKCDRHTAEAIREDELSELQQKMGNDAGTSEFKKRRTPQLTWGDPRQLPLRPYDESKLTAKARMIRKQNRLLLETPVAELLQHRIITTADIPAVEECRHAMDPYMFRVTPVSPDTRILGF